MRFGGNLNGSSVVNFDLASWKFHSSVVSLSPVTMRSSHSQTKTHCYYERWTKWIPFDIRWQHTEPISEWNFLSKHFDGIRFEIMPHPMIVKRCQMPSTSNASINTELCDEFNPIEMPYSIYWWSAVPNVIGFVTFRCALVIGIGTFVHWNWIRFFVPKRGPKRNFAHLPSNRNSNNCSFWCWWWWWWCW